MRDGCRPSPRHPGAHSREVFIWKRLSCLATAGIALLITPAGLAAGGLRAGVALVEITPPLGAGMYGFANRKGGATGVLDPLMARVLVLEEDEKRMALLAGG